MDNPGDGFRILALSGGGYLGVFTARVLAELEVWAGEPLGRRFDLVAGTSVGGILAVALAFEVPMAKVLELFIEHGSEIFSARPPPSSRIGRWLDLSRSVFSPKYRGKALHDALSEHLGERRLRDALHPLVVPAVDVSRCLTKIFKTAHSPASASDESLLAVDVAMATCAAPAYFPSVRIGESIYADGGLFAVAPDQVALHEAEHYLRIDPQQVRMLSIGTAAAGYQPALGVSIDDGALGWLTDGRLILTMVSVQQQHVQAMLRQRLADRYLCVDATWPRGQPLGIDVATRQAAEILTELGVAALRDADRSALAKLFGLQPPAPKSAARSRSRG